VNTVIIFRFYKMRGNFLNNFLISRASRGKRKIGQTFRTCLNFMRPCARDDRVNMYCKSICVRGFILLRVCVAVELAGLPLTMNMRYTEC
jgi:hypothetical protein